MPTPQAVTGVGGAMGDIGQNISRALSVTSPHDDKMQHLQEELLRSQINASDVATQRSAVETMASLKPAGHPPSPEPRRSTLAWPLSIPDDIDRQLHAESAMGLNDVQSHLHDIAVRGHNWLTDVLSNQVVPLGW